MDSVIYLLVEWIDENKFSAVRKSSIVDGVLRGYSGEKLLGLQTKIFWKKKEYDGIIHQYGRKVDMEHEVSLFAEQATKNNNRFGKADEDRDIDAVLGNEPEKDFFQPPQNPANRATLSTITDVLNKVDENEDIPSRASDPAIPSKIEESYKAEIAVLKNKLDAAIKRKEKYKNLAKSRKRKLDEVNTLHQTKDMIFLADSVSIHKSKIDTIKTISDSPQVFARNLMRMLFKEEELLGKSLFGRKCNALKNEIPKPEIDPSRRDAIILFSLRHYGFEVTDVKKKKIPVLREVKRSLGDYLREIRNKHAVAAPTNE